MQNYDKLGDFIKFKKNLKKNCKFSNSVRSAKSWHLRFKIKKEEKMIRFFKFGLLFIGVLVFVSFTVVAQTDTESSPDWMVSCIAGYKKKEPIPCKNFTSSGSSSFNMTTEFLTNWSLAGTSFRLTFIRKNKDLNQGLKIIEVLPDPNKSDKNWEYKFTSGLQGPGGPGTNRYFSRLTFLCKNPQNSDNGRGGFCENGPYNGKMKLKDTKTGEVFTINFTVNVKTIKSKKK